jgi:SnoaL-like domain
MSDIAALTARIEKLEHELAIQQDIHHIRRVQYTYGYFIDKSQYNEVVDLFADDADVWFLGGIYKGKAGVRRLYIERFQRDFTQGHNGPRYGWLLDHPQLQMVIDVAPDRGTAQLRGRSTMQAGQHESAEGLQRAWGLDETAAGRRRRAWWEGGIYENDYVRDKQVWKIKVLRYFPFWHGTFAEGWAKTPIDYIPMAKTLYPQNPVGPDELMNPQPRLWPATDTVPFHYPHPVTGKPIVLDNSRAREGFKDG